MMSILSDVANIPVPIEFVLFGLTLVGVGVFHHRTLRVSLIGLGTIVLYKLLFTGFESGPGLNGLSASFVHEWVILMNLLALLTGFALLADFFESDSRKLPGKVSASIVTRQMEAPAAKKRTSKTVPRLSLRPFITRKRADRFLPAESWTLRE